MSEIRRQAQRRRLEIGLDSHAPIPAEAVIAACLAHTGLERNLVPPDDAILAGAQAVLDLQIGMITQDATLSLARLHFDAAHEMAHLWLHGGSCHCAPEDLDPLGTEETPGSPLMKVDGYSPQQKRESEANLFAGELLLPGPLARTLFLDSGRTSAEIAAALGLPHSVVQRQLADAVLLPPLSEAGPEGEHRSKPEHSPASATVTLDPSQLAAAEIETGPLLLGAGPGTGKTKTLVGRCQFLTQTQNIPAEKILALTFSRKAAQEMRQRLLAAGVGTENAGPWVGTFHAFGLEILRRFGERLSLPTELKLLDQLDAVTLLENHLAELQLDVLDNLYDPAIHLSGILGQIGRAKDELCPPARYAELCREVQRQAEAEADALAMRSGRILKRDQEAAAKGLERAAKSLEVARCYEIYERLMRQNGYLDYGDLIYQTVRLLETHPDVLALLQAEYPQVLADEYQDVNRACARLVRLLAGDEAHGLWAVGDHRQSIYQFQGASPANVAAFGRDYPNGRRLELGVNYRSRRPIVELFGAAAEASWQAFRGVSDTAGFPAITVAAAPDGEGQAAGIAGAIEALKAEGWAYRDQAILCRTHSQAEALAERLAAQDIPVLYLGALLERPEIKDLLCLLSLLADTQSSALVRVAQWPEYAVPRAETLWLLAQIRQEETTLHEALKNPDLHPGLRRLGTHLAELNTLDSDPAALLRHYLFSLSHYLHTLHTEEPRPFVRLGQTFAIHQLLGLATGFDRRLVAPHAFSKSQDGPPNKVREFLTHLRRLESSGSSPRGSLPAEAEALDAVRLLTAHAAKGLEFPVVFVPNLGAGQFPARGRQSGIPEPPGLADSTGLDEDREMDEEGCLFFVALSRARDHLIVSRAELTETDRAVAPSPLLTRIEPGLLKLGLTETHWPSGRAEQEEDAEFAEEFAEEFDLDWDDLPEYSSSALETYMRCPRQYLYQYDLKLPGTFFGGGYPQFHACVRRTLHWLEDAWARGETPTEDDWLGQLELFWEENGPVGHRHESKYKNSARQMLHNAVRFGRETERRADKRTLRAALSSCQVSVRADALLRDSADGTLIVARHLTGKPGDKDHTDKRLALYRAAAQQTYPDETLRLELRYLANGTARVLEPPETKQEIKWEADRLRKYEQAAYDIQRGRFLARPESGDECGRCAFRLICPL